MKHTTNRSIRTFLAALGLGSALAAFAGDSAADPVYNSGWSTGQNGGTGWQPWSLTGLGFGIGNSNTNGNGSGPGINTAGRSWALGHPATSDYAQRSMTAPLSVNDWLYIDIDPATGIGNSFDLRLQWGTSNVFTLANTPSGFLYADSTGFHSLTNTVSSGGYRFGFTRTGNGTYGASFHELGTINTAVWSGTIGSSTIDGIAVQVFSNGGPHDKHFINSMSIVPEPGTLLALGAGIGALVARRRRRSR